MSVLSIVKYILLLVIGGAIVILAQYNRNIVELHGPWEAYNISMPIYLIIFISILIGMLTGLLLAIIAKIKAFRQSRRYKNQIDALENEIAALKIDGEIIDAEPIKE